jgi:hypothetical protein
MLIPWFLFWRFVGRRAASYAWRVHRRRKYTKYLDNVKQKWKNNNPKPIDEKVYADKEKRQEEEQERKMRRSRHLRDEIEKLFGHIPQPDISRDRDLKDSLLKKYCNANPQSEGTWVLVAIKSFIYYTTIVWWILKLYKTGAKDRKRLDSVSEEESPEKN